MAQAVLELREERPRWGKDKLAVLLQKDGWQASVSMVGRILTSLKARGVLREPPANGISARKRQRARPYAVRKPKQYQAKEPGDLVQVDTLDVRPLPGVVLKHFTARDVVSRWDVVEVHTRATATAAKAFLDTLQARLPFPLKAIQVDGGSEFQASFEQAANSAVYTCSSYLPGHPSSMAMWSGPSGPIPRSSMKSTRTTWRSFL